MKCIKYSLVLLFMMLATFHSFGQEESEASSYKGLAIDIFPLINQIFSDDGSTSLFELTHLWGDDQHRFELGIAPEFRKISSDDENISDFNSFGAAISFFHGKQFAIGKKWQGTFGMSYRYRYNQQTSKSERFNNNFKIKTTVHDAGLGPQLMFGFQISEAIQIRSRISAILSWSESKTKIDDGPFEAGDQAVTNFDFGINPPQVLDLILFF